MISLKKHLEKETKEPQAVASECYRAALKAMADSGARVCPAVADEFRVSLLQLRDQLVLPVNGAKLESTGQKVEHELQEWGTRASEYYDRKTQEIKDVILTLAHTVEAVGEKDDRYQSRFRGLTQHLQSIVGLDDLAEIRHLIELRANELNSCVEQMVKEGESSMTHLRAEIAVYEKRLAEAENLSQTDTVTKLKNRHGIEAAVNSLIQGKTSFSLMILDLNGFKQVNDKFGHLAGDQLLVDFASELKSQFRSEDVVGRWGGDEFVVVVKTDLAKLCTRLSLVRKWVFGDYKIRSAEGGQKVKLTAAIGVAEWHPGDSADDVFTAADTAMYQDKANAN